MFHQYSMHQEGERPRRTEQAQTKQGVVCELNTSKM